MSASPYRFLTMKVVDKIALHLGVILEVRTLIQSEHRKLAHSLYSKKANCSGLQVTCAHHNFAESDLFRRNTREATNSNNITSV